jgi:hypothetical protein
MQANGVDGRLLPLVILTELGGGLLVLVGLKTRWAAIALFGFTALFFHLGADQAIQFRKNIAMAGGILLWPFSVPAPGPSTPGAGAPDRGARWKPTAQLRNLIMMFVSCFDQREYGGWKNSWTSDSGPCSNTGLSFENVSKPSRPW